MPPKRTDIHHLTFHLLRSTILLSVPETPAELKTQLVPALAPLVAAGAVPAVSAADDIQVWEDREAVEGSLGPAGVRVVEGAESVGRRGWPRWKTCYISLRGADGEFGQPVYTIPDPMDGDAEEEAA